MTLWFLVLQEAPELVSGHGGEHEVVVFSPQPQGRWIYRTRGPVVLARFYQLQFRFRPPGAGSGADGDSGPRPGPAAVFLRGDGGPGEENPLECPR